MACLRFLMGATRINKGGVLAENADYCKFDNDWAWLGSWVCSFWLQKHLGSDLESDTTHSYEIIFCTYMPSMHYFSEVNVVLHVLCIHAIIAKREVKQISVLSVTL